MGVVSRQRKWFLDYPTRQFQRIRMFGQKSFLCVVCGVWGPREQWKQHRCDDSHREADECTIHVCEGGHEYTCDHRCEKENTDAR